MKIHRAQTAIAFTCACVAFASQQARPPAETVHTLLETFSQGRHADALALLRDVEDVEDLRRLVLAFRRAADDWVTSGRTADRQYRRATAAVLFLEVGRVAIEYPRAYSEWRKDVEYYCDVLRTNEFPQPGARHPARPAGAERGDGAAASDGVRGSGGRRPPAQFERLWFLASVALLHGARDKALLAGLSTDPQSYNSTSGHAFHALGRFPDESRFALAPVIVRHEASLVANRPGTPRRFLVARLARMGNIGLVDVSDKVLAATISDLTRLAGDERTGPEARLRLGILLFHLDRLAESAVHLQAAAAQSSDPFVTYMAELTRGLVLDHSGLPELAESALRAAVEILPNAQSGVMALASRLYRSGQREEAATLMDRLAATTGAHDPWREYSFGDLRFWTRYQTDLRDMLGAMGRS